MFARIRQRFQDMRTIKALCEGAEKYANSEGHKEPGVEHFVLAALDLPDGAARKAFQRVNADPNRFHQAVVQQYKDALEQIGVDSAALDADTAPVSAQNGVYRAKPSGQQLMQRMIDVSRAAPGVPLNGAHVVWAATMGRNDVASRAFRVMNIDPASLAEAANAEFASAKRS
jgi:ATP-dependent Clp protease ATP-binding subunit ClpA